MKTEEDREGNEANAAYRSRARINGWSWPPHPLQFVAWFFLIVFNVIYHFVVVPVLPYHWQPAGHIIPGIIIGFHVVVHIVCVSIDPADPNVRKKKTKDVKTFDRNEHKHVIENFRCYVCEVPVGTKSKHCSSCNKCVSDFDHHCKWLNNCVGERNYKLFIMCLTSALITCFIVLCVSLYVCIAYWAKPSLLHPDISGKDTDYHDGFTIFGLCTSGTVFFTVICIMVALLLLTVCLLGHLLGFHIYLISRNLSTYEYIVLERELEMKKQMNIESQSHAVKEENMASPGKMLQKHNKVAPMDIGAQEQLELVEQTKKNKTTNKKQDNFENGSVKSHSRPPSTTLAVINENKLTKKNKRQLDKDDTQSNETINSVTSVNNQSSERSDESMQQNKRKHKGKFNMKNRVQPEDTDSELFYPLSQWLPPQPNYSVEQHYISPIGLSQSLPETYLEQHIVQRFPANATAVQGHRQIPLQLAVPRRSSFSVQRAPQSIAQHFARPIHGNISIKPVGPAVDYNSDSAESLHEIPVENNSNGLASSYGSTGYARLWPSQQNLSNSLNNSARFQSEQYFDNNSARLQPEQYLNEHNVMQQKYVNTATGDVYYGNIDAGNLYQNNVQILNTHPYLY